MLIPIGHEENTVRRWPGVTLGVIGLCVVIHLLGVSKDSWALVPAEFSLLKVLTAMFVHGDGWHLGFNLFFLYMVGPVIEDVWGRPYFAAFYFLSGLAGAATHTFFYPDSMVGGIGASGAIAGVMGAFAVRYRKARIRFLFLAGPGFSGPAGTFLAPAALMLCLWLVREVFWGFVVLNGQAWSVVGHWYHVGGFLFGVTVANLIAGFDLEERYLRGKIESALAILENTAVEKAYEARGRHQLEEAWGLLAEELRHHPDNREAALSSWYLGVELGEPRRALRSMLRCIRQELQEGEKELGLAHWDEVRAHLPGTWPELFLRVRLAELLLAQLRNADAAELLVGVAEEAPGLPPFLLLRLARLNACVHTEAAREITGIALADPGCPPELREELEAIRCRVVKEEEQRLARLEARTPFGRPPFVLQSARAESVSRRYLLVSVEGEGRMALSPERVHAVGTARVEQRLHLPYLIVDLFLDPLLPAASRVSVIRFAAWLSDPSESVDVFGSLVSHVVEAGRCRLFPRQDLGSFLTYSSAAEYEEAVLTEMGLPPVAGGPPLTAGHSWS